MAVKDCDDRIDNRDTDLKDRAVKAFEDIASFLTLTGPFDLVLVQVLDHLRFTDKAKAQQDRKAGAAFTGTTVIQVRCECESCIRIGGVSQFAENCALAVTFGFVRNVGRLVFDPFGVGLCDQITLRAFLKDFLKTNDIGIHGLQLFRQPIGFPCIFFWRVFLEFIVFFVLTN